jgi:hypothetical protein
VLGGAAEVPKAWLGQRVDLMPYIPGSDIEWDVARAVRRASDRLPWTPTCLAQAAAGQVMLRCETDGDSVRLEVIDTGVGIAAEHISDICDEFYQVGIEAQQSREGYGLGLSIVRRLANLLHTKLDIRSTLGAGSTFSVRLPRVRRRRTAPPYSPTPEPAPITDTALGTGQRILLV